MVCSYMEESNRECEGRGSGVSKCGGGGGVLERGLIDMSEIMREEY